ncbi:hypothetical protein MT340_009130 [Staphylococcus sp. NRL 16/872]|uniref:hypothetical protein n=1 Tax=Staphylococcus sp. NRL 16/872 TaxID=2930131 RepID=UPI001FB2F976|nr:MULTISPECIES: hypothetical protein [unclassified Staphylococcus]WEN68769.1 hypothetical protein MT340_009130 [Staphylococcus sp. NRL 16/872]
MTGKSVKDAIIRSLQDGYATKIATVDGEKYKIDNYGTINDEFCMVMSNNKTFTIDTKSIVSITQSDVPSHSGLKKGKAKIL